MTTLHLLALLFAVAVASYTQALTGFAFGLILVGIVSALHLVPLELIATTVSVLGIVNGFPALLRGLCHIKLRLFLPTAISAGVAVVAGFELVRIIDDSYVPLIKAALGVVVLIFSVTLALPAKRAERISGYCSSALYGCAAGLVGGLFASSGPPLVYHFYRQPIKPAAVKATLLAVSLVVGATRLTMSAFHGELGWDSLILSAEALPIVIAFSWISSKYSPSLSQPQRRRIASALLAVMGAAMVWPSLGTAQLMLSNLVPHLRIPQG